MANAPKKRPKRVYKYRTFSDLSLQALVQDMVFFADPSTFNDPLDARPAFENDLPSDELERVLRELVRKRVAGEMTAAARTIRYRGPRTSEHISKHALKAADLVVEEILYYAGDPNYEMDDPIHFLLGSYLGDEVRGRYNRGIVSLAERATCPLMWSHYGDQHKGICLGYSAPPDVDMEPVAYGGARSIKLSLVRDMVDGDQTAARAVDQAVLLKKAKAWSYEREWRLIGDRGLQHSPLELEEVIFGMRCPGAVMFAVARALENRHCPIKLYEIREKPHTFLLQKVSADVAEMLAMLPRRSRDVFEAFEKVSLPNDVDER